MNARDRHPELLELMTRLCDGGLDDAQGRRLNALLEDDGEAQQLYAEYMSVHQGLHWHCAPMNVGAINRAIEGATAPPPAPIGWRGWVAAAAVLLTLGAALWFVGGSKPPAEPGRGIAVITQVADAEWGARGMAVEVGAPVPAGKLLLRAGLAQIDFYSGASVILEGPAELDLLSEDRAMCLRGRLRARVPPQARGFTLLSPDAEVVDMSTEFGMKVDPGSSTEVHVFEGRVSVASKGRGGTSEITAGYGVRLRADREPQQFAADERAFADPGRMMDLAGKGHVRRFERWQSLKRLLLEDPTLVVHYDFEPRGSWGRTLRNGARHMPGRAEGAVVGCRWVEGRWPDKRALEFKRPSDRILVDIPGEYESISIATWVRFDGLDHRWNAIMHTDGWSRGDVHTHVEAPGLINIDFNRRERLSSHTLLGADDLGRWIHLAWVYDAEARRLRFFFDGREDASMPITTSGPIRFGSAQIGNWDRQHRNLNGQMDEFMIFGRALSATEIREMAVIGRPH